MSRILLSLGLGPGFHLVTDDEIARDPSAAPAPIDYTPLVSAAHLVAVWLLDVARSHADDPDDVDAIERVARAVEARFAGRCTCAGDLTEQDAVSVAATLIDAFEIDLGLPGLGDVAGGLYDATDGDFDKIKNAVADAIATRAAHDLVGLFAGARLERVGPRGVRRVPRVAHGVDEATTSTTLG